MAPTPLLFCLLVLAVWLLVVRGLRRALTGPGAILVLFLAYLAAPGILAGLGLLDRYTPLPAPALALLAGLTLLTVAVTAFFPLGGFIAMAVRPQGLIALQGFRIAVEWLLHRLYLEGVVPVQMTWTGRNFDIVTGVTGLALGAAFWRARSLPRGLILAWNVLGLGLLVNIVVIAILSTPVPFRRFAEGPPNLLPSEFPYVWLPSFLVQVALGSHLLLFRQLQRRSPM